MSKSLNISGIIGRLRQNINVVLWGALLVLVLAEGLVIQRSVAILLSAHHVEPVPNTQLVRVNFPLYEAIAQRFNAAASFIPTPVTARDPFGTPTLPK